MRKKYRLSTLLVAVSCLLCGNAAAIDVVDNVYQISNAADFAEFGNVVTTTDNTASAVLTADIDFAGVTWTPIGTSAKPFKGTLDGKYFHIKNLVVSAAADYQGLFGYVSGGCTIKNLTIDASCSFSGAAFVGAFAGGTAGGGNVYLTNVGNEGTVTASAQNAGGFIGVSMSGACVFIVKNSYNAGNVTGANESAAFTGWAGGGSSFTNCYNSGEISGLDGSNKLARNNPTFTNCYDIAGVQGTAIPEGSLASGAFAFMLNGYQTNDSVVWRQNIDAGTADGHPVTSPSHGLVYAGTLHCDGTPYDGATYTNSGANTLDEHDFVDGVCSYCHNVDPDYYASILNDSVYEVSDAKQLNYIANLVNTSTDKKFYVRLMNDIDFSEYTQAGVEIGIGGHDFSGWFDGQGHTVTINYNTTAKYTALFHFLKNGTVRNLTTEGQIASNDEAGQKGTCGGSGGIVGYLVGSNSCVENCISKVTITSECEGSYTHGGIVGVAEGGTIKNSAFLGAFATPTEGGNSGIMGWTSNGVSITNCYVFGEFNVVQDDCNMIAQGKNLVLTNCYYVKNASCAVPAGVTEVTEEQIMSGQLAYYLNGMRSDTVSWYQNIDTEAAADEYPVPFSTHAVVYAVGTLNCDGSPQSEDDGYSNYNTSITLPHEYADGVCTFCHKIKDDYMAPVNGYYEISTPAQLNWFARTVNQGNNKINAKLTADIDFSEYTSSDTIMIGDGNNFMGTFDGQCHTVTVNYDRQDVTANAALFLNVQNANIKNLKVDGVVSSGYCIGGIMVRAYGASVIENCVSAATLKSFVDGDASMGGISAAAFDHSTFRNCAFVGKMIAPTGSGNGGIVSYSNGWVSVVIENCYVAIKELNIKEDEGSAMICRNSPTMRNNYYVDCGTLVIDKFATLVTTDQVTNGELCFTLNGYQNGGKPWTQTLGTDEYPVPFNGDNVVYAIGKMSCSGTPEDVSYSNTEGELVTPDHLYNDETGVCETCGGRIIKTPAQLLALSQEFNTGFAPNNVNVVVANDIDMAGVEGYEGIGTTDIPFQGKFDGGGHVIKNLVINTTKTYQGLFGVVSAGAEVKNITLDSSCSVTVVGGGYAGGIIGGTTGTGLVIIENCGNEADVTAGGANAAGIVGVNYGSTALLRITNCYNTGTITGDLESAGISGWTGQSAEITNCYNIGEVNGVQGTNTFVRFSSSPYYTNCFETIGKQVTNIDNDFVVSGALCYALNDSVDNGTNFYQTLGTDSHPVLFKTHGMVANVDGTYTNNVVGIKAVADKKNANGTVRIYSIDGMRIPSLQKGINIVRKADGTTQKVLVK